MAPPRRNILDHPLTPALLQQIGVFQSQLQGWSGYALEQDWQRTYQIWTCHGYDEHGNFDAGYLQLTKERSGETFKLHVKQKIALLDGVLHEIQGVVECQSDTLATPIGCTLEHRVSDRNGQTIDDLSSRYSARLEQGQWHYSVNGRSGARAISGALSSDWSLFDAVQRLPFAPFEAQFDVLDHWTVLKPVQTLRYREDLVEQLADGGPRLACFSRHGYATVPQEYWLDEQHRLVLLVAYNMAYLLNENAPELYERARAARRRQR
jgi:hypothetical protein